MASALVSAFFVIDSGYTGKSKQVLRPQDIKESIYDSVIFSDTEYLMVGDKGKIFRSVDGGKDWQEVQSGTRLPLFSVCFVDSKNGWISGNSGLILHTTNGGITWSKQGSGTKKHLLGISFRNIRIRH